MAQRFFVIPSYTSIMYFEVYPDALPHVQWADLRQVREFFGLEALQPRNGFISVDVAESLTGLLWGANAGLVAESWAAAGYLGIIMGSMTFGIFGFVVDRYTAQRLGQINLTPLPVYYWLGLLVYGNSAMLYALVEHGLWFVPFLYCFAIERAMKSSTNGLYMPVMPTVKPPRSLA